MLKTPLTRVGFYWLGVILYFFLSMFFSLADRLMLKKILLLIDSLGSGGAQRQMVGLAKLLQDRGYPIKIIYYHPICFYQAYLDEHHIPNEYVAGTENKIKRMFLIARAIRHFQPGIVISYLDAPNMMAW